MIKHIKSNFVAGLLVLFPAFITILVFKFMIEKISRWFLDPTIKFIRPYLDETYLVVLAKFAAFFVIVAVIILIGFATRHIIARRFIHLAEGMLLKVPLLNKIYGGVREVSKVLFGDSKQFFSKTIMLEYPRKGLYSIGFIMAESVPGIKDNNGTNMVSVFMPTAPNPTSGVVLVVPREEIIDVPLSVEEGLKVIISGGAVIPARQTEGGQK